MKKLFFTAVFITLLAGADSAAAQNMKMDFPFPEHYSRVQRLALFLESSVNAGTFHTYCVSDNFAEPDGQLADNLEFVRKAYLKIYKEKAGMKDALAQQTLDNDLKRFQEDSLANINEDICKGPDKVWYTQYVIFNTADERYLADQLNSIFEQDK
ncbi:MAG: hypothetical protein JKY71_09760 [Alphaproteobacteria bacterium]|nr:hypothetical protein [Alphaproteobacteria bacterium]